MKRKCSENICCKIFAVLAFRFGGSLKSDSIGDESLPKPVMLL